MAEVLQIFEYRISNKEYRSWKARPIEFRGCFLRVLRDSVVNFFRVSV